METRETLRRFPVFVLFVIALGLWLFLGGLRVLSLLDWSAAYDGFVGQTVRSGWIGLLVILTALGLVVVFYSELSSDRTTFQRFPPDGEE